MREYKFNPSSKKDMIEYRLHELESGRERDIESHKLLFKKIDFLESEVKTVTGEFPQLKNTLDEIREDLKQIKSKPRVRLDFIINSMISVTVATVLTYLFYTVGIHS